MKRERPFDLLEPGLKELVIKRFKRPTPIQEIVIPAVLDGKNALTISETGSGKTEACLLPIFNEVVKKEPKPISILYITPLRSLNRDLLKRILWWANKLEFEVSVRHGDTSQYERTMQAQNPPDMLILTPETLQAILVGKLMRKHLKNVKYCVIDEVHELVENKRGVQLSVGLERLKELTGGLQIIGLSATIGCPEKVANFLTGDKPCEIINAAKTRGLEIGIEAPEPKKEDIKVSSDIFTAPETVARLRRIADLIRQKRSVLVFTNTRETAEILSSRFKTLDRKLKIEPHHSSLSKEVRIKAENDFKDEKTKALLCTSSLELGIDIGSIDFVIQYLSPRQVTKLLQRIGRSGHTIDLVSKGAVIASDADDCFESTVITAHAINGPIEVPKIYSRALDVLAHQIVGLAMDEYKIPLEKAYKTIKRAHPYKGLSKKDFLALCRFVQKLGYLWVDDKFSPEPVLKRRKRAFEYYYQNLSTIPDVKNYKIFDVVANQAVGTLDAEFVALHATPGTAFICKGQPWKILEISQDRVRVEPGIGIEGAIPAWEGELIPVPFEVAQSVGRLRREITDYKDPVKQLLKEYPITQSVAKKMVQAIDKQAKFGFIPTDKDILIEYGKMDKMAPNEPGFSGLVSGARPLGGARPPIGYVIIHSCFGSLVNETLGRVLTTLLSNRIGSVGLQTDPYRIIIKTPNPADWSEVVRTFKTITPKTVKEILEPTLIDTELFHWRFLHVAKRFGIISRGADFGKGYIKAIIEAYTNTPAHFETLNEIFTEKLDIEKSVQVLNRIRSGQIGIMVKQGLSPLGKAGLVRRHEIVAPKKPEREIFKVFKARLFDTRIRLVCCQCGWGITYTVKNLPKTLACLNCGARLLGVIKPHEIEKEKLLKKSLQQKEVTKEENKIVSDIMDTASLVIASGPDAVLALAGRGIGSKTASRILARQNKGDALLKDILKAERLYAQTRQFWRD